jgi:phospholipid/cholesterol/gamma-HCH transport system substrate-binding protein
MTRAIRKHATDFIALVVLFVIALGVSGYIIFSQSTRSAIPLLEATPKKLNFEFSNAQAVTPGQGQSVRVAGVEVGKITDVHPKNGVAVVTADIEPKFWDKIQVRTDATALLRPRTGLKDMFIELDPGGKGARVPDNGSIPVENTSPDVNPDEVLAAFDTDTRSYLQLLINGAGKGLKNRGNDLNAVFKALGPTERDLNRVSTAVAERRVALKELIHRYGDLTNTLADKDREIKTLVTAADATFQAFASQQSNISLAVSRLPGTLRQTSSTLTKVNSYAKLLSPTLNSLRPAFRQLDTTNRQVLPFVREAYPITKNKIRPFVQVARPFVRSLRPAAVNLARATPDFTASFHELNRFFNMAAYNPGGAEGLTGNAQQDANRNEGYLYWAAWLGQLTDSMFSTSDANGSFRRAALGFDCATIRSTVTSNPAAGPLIGLSNSLNDTALCGGDNSNQSFIPQVLPKSGQTTGTQTANKRPASTQGAPAKGGKP